MTKTKEPKKAPLPSAADATVGERIAAAREASGSMTRAAIADALGVSPSQVYNWEHDISPVPKKHRAALAGILHIEEAQLVDEGQAEEEEGDDAAPPEEPGTAIAIRRSPGALAKPEETAIDVPFRIAGPLDLRHTPPPEPVQPELIPGSTAPPEPQGELFPPSLADMEALATLIGRERTKWLEAKRELKRQKDEAGITEFEKEVNIQKEHIEGLQLELEKMALALRKKEEEKP